MAGALTIKLVRHGESTANLGSFDPQREGDFRAVLTEKGLEQARHAGTAIGAAFLQGALVYLSPYARTRQTLDGVLEGASTERKVTLGSYEDPRLREMDHGYSDVQAQRPMRETHGWFYYRYTGGESPADVYDRISSFLESMMRQVERKHATRVIIVTHGMAIRCFVMRFLRLTVEEFESIDNPHNGDVVTIGPIDTLQDFDFERSTWRASGLRRLPPPPHA
jgi:broad specificity phosphatase PhoE